MLERVPNTKNGYYLPSVSNGKNSDDFRDTLRTYSPVKCIICNQNTSKRITYGVGGRSKVFTANGIVNDWKQISMGFTTINNHTPDGVIYINYMR